ncbi:sce7726 family protein [Leptospira noguchii]|uniref:Sce7726 family protein n=2 Tax=Leptospira noguchii TaxID=28182 RepID=A0AAE9GCM7_9LEPT|nr:sce7726 family protein [Leptospira noguchii]UOG56360.1 sce7726 family protein [Leptospira noguchii]
MEEETDTILSELRISNSKADLTMFNGKSVGYEIKSELDKPVRLKTQISDYLSFFQYSYLVSHKTFIENYSEDLPKSIGIICVNRNGSVEIVKKAIDNTDNLSHSALFNTLRKPEYSDIIEKYYNYIPRVPNGIFFKECKKLFDKIPINVANALSVDSLKRRRVSSSISYIKKLPIYLQYLVYRSDLNQEALKKLNSFVEEKI